MKLNVKVNNDSYFSVLLSLLGDIPPFSTLRKKELLVFAEILRYNDTYRAVPIEARMEFIFSYETRLKIAEKLEVSRDTIYNIMKGLRDKEFIDHKAILNDYDKIFIKYKSLEFNFDFKEDDE